MKQTLFSLVSFFLCLLCSCQQQFGESVPPQSIEPESRTSVGNGTGEHPADIALWTGKQAIRVCSKRSDDFVLSGGEVRSLVDQSFRTIRQYLVDKKVNDSEAHPKRGIKVGDPELVMNHQWLEVCDGTEDLILYLGQLREPLISGREKRQIEAERQKYVDSPSFYGLSQGSLPQPPDGNRNKAFIWMENPQRRYSNLSRAAFEALLTHELLHTAGCGHVPETIMDNVALLDSLSHYQNSPNDPGLEDVLSIDWKSGRELLLCESCAFSLDLTVKVLRRDLWLKGISQFQDIDGYSSPATLGRSHGIPSSQMTLVLPSNEARQPREMRIKANFTEGLAVGKSVFRTPVVREGQWTTISSYSFSTRYRGFSYAKEFGIIDFEIVRNGNEPLSLQGRGTEFKIVSMPSENSRSRVRK